MQAVKVPLNKAQKTKEDLIKRNVLDNNFKIKKEQGYVYFPISDLIEGYDVVEQEFEEIDRKPALKQALQRSLNEKELEIVKTAYDIIGDIAILEIDQELQPKAKHIAKALLVSNDSVKTVLMKGGIHEGEFRTQNMIYLAGEKKKETVHKENGVKLKLNVEDVYFSPRLSTERKRIMQQVRPGEEVLVMFSGCAPYPCVIAKNTEAREIIGIELNPQGHIYGIENVRLNKLKNVVLINGDVKLEVPKLKRQFDRILMPLPKTADEFLPAALTAARAGTIIHFYDFLNESEFDLAKRKIDIACQEFGCDYELLDIVKCGQHAPHVFRICVDFKIV